MTNNLSGGKRLTQNTFMLYCRTFLTMAIGIFTSRVILQALGVEDYGTYNVVGGFVSIFSVISACLIGTTQRYLTFELGKTQNSNPQKVFGVSIIIHITLAIILLFLFETLGVWALNTKINIPHCRLIAANWTYQFSIVAFLVNIVSTPYNAIIIAHEKMKAFAYIGLFDACAKLGVAYLINMLEYDPLILYGFLLLCISIIDRFIYSYYCNKHFNESKFILVKEKCLYIEILKFAWQNFLTSLASIMMTQGVNIVLNLFFGVVVNAARGIATQVESITIKFVNDFMTALNPQITKEYASGNIEGSYKLCLRGSKFSFFLMLVISVPVIAKAEELLDLWLKTYPIDAIIFMRLTFILAIVTLLSSPLITIILATGNLKKNTYLIGGVRLLTIPILCILFICGGQPYYAYIVVILIEVVSLYIRLYVIKDLTGLESYTLFHRNVLLRCLSVSIFSFGFAYVLCKFNQPSIGGMLQYFFLTVASTVTIIGLIGLTKEEKKILKNVVSNKLLKRQ